jgi:hypothetical protein
MKKLTFILMAAASLAFMNCSGDDDGGDCFSCDATGEAVKYCKSGDNNYSVSVGGIEVGEYPLGDMTWEEFKADTQEACN